MGIGYKECKQGGDILARVKISIANKENDDWLKKIDGGKWQRQDLRDHVVAKKLGKNDPESKGSNNAD